MYVNYMRILKYFIIIIASFIILAFLGILGYGTYLFFTLPDIKHLEDYQPPLTTVVYADNGEVLGEFFTERRYFVSLDQIPPYLIKAFIAAEDERFYEHKGLDWLGMLRALITDIKEMAIVQGGSTITQQTVKSLLLSHERTISRKAREIMLAYLLEKRLSKDEILTIYLNQIYFGHGAYGVEAAARTYFGKHVWELNLAEAALIAGLPKGPGYYSPYKNLSKAKARQHYVLNRMVTCGYISKEEAEIAYNMPLKLKRINYSYPACAYFLEYIRQYLIKKYGYKLTYQGGLSVYTTANIDMHEVAQKALLRGIEELKKRHLDEKGNPEGALLCLETNTGFIKVMIGGKDFKKSQFNRAVQACRQPGSAFKPIIYAAALDKGYTPASIIYDYPIIFVEENEKDKSIKVWRPHNYEGRFYGKTSLREALVHSRNTVTVRLLNNIGIKYAINYARKLGITSPLNPDLSLALGSNCVSLLELTTAYAVFANQGQYLRPIAITKIIDAKGHILEENLPQPQPVISADTAYIITNILADVIKKGTGRRVRRFKRPVAGKTGTTNDYTDAWFIGYTPYYVTGVWIGYDTLKSLGEHETGGKAAAPIWLYFMKEVEKELPIKPFSIPPNVTFAKIGSHIECFRKGNLPNLKEKKDILEIIYKECDF